MGVLLKCATCGGKVSSAAKACPHCGEPDFHGDGIADHRVDDNTLHHGLAIQALADPHPAAPATVNGAASVQGDPITNGTVIQSRSATLPLEPEREPLEVDTTIQTDQPTQIQDDPPAPIPERLPTASPVRSIPLLVHWASLGCLSEIQQSIAEFPDVNVAGDDGYTALHAAAEHGHTDIVQFLLDHGANCSLRFTPNRQSPYAGFTPLMLAEKTGNQEVAELIRTKMEADQAQRLAAAPRPRSQHSPIAKQAIADVAASARQSQPRVVNHNHTLGEKHLDVIYVFANRSDLQTARRNGKCEWLQFETRAALRKRGFPLQIYPTINIWFKDKTEYYGSEGR
jgi:ankyrin repeat protein